MYSVYIIYSEKRDEFYKGQTSDLVDRLLRHNEGRNKYTKEGGEWKLLWSGIKETRSAAVRLESILKK
jgi:putative endonuclease